MLLIFKKRKLSFKKKKIVTMTTLTSDSLDSRIIPFREGGYRADIQFPVLSSYGMCGKAVGTSDRFMHP